MEKETSLLGALLDARKKIDDINNEIKMFYDDKIKTAKKEAEDAEKKLIEYMENRDIKSFKSSLLKCSATHHIELRASVQKDNYEEGIRWLDEDCGRPDLLTQSIHWKKLSSFIKSLIQDGKAVPSDKIKSYYQHSIKISV